MTISSNKYAAKLFSEHPIAIWPLDDDISFLSLINEDERDLTNWSTTDCSTTNSPNLPDEISPIDVTNFYGITGDYTQAGISGQFILNSGPLFTFDSLNQDMNTFSINFYLYQDSGFVQSYEFGYKYYNSALSQYEEVLSTIIAPSSSQWIRFCETFSVSEFDSDTCEIILKINVSSGGGVNDYDFVMAGLSVGQWSETTSAKSIGSLGELVPSSANLSGIYGVPADQYGPLSDNAYHIIENSALLAKNEGTPIIFGSENVTRIYPSTSSLPSLIFPGKGFMSKSGKYKTFSLEFWIRIDPNIEGSHRILGPLDSDYGLYVSKGFLSLVFGRQISSFNIEEWYRPMLIHIVYSSNKISLLINAESVIEIDFDIEQIYYPETNEWLGFFSNSNIELFEIDCISLLPYEIPIQVAKRRFVWAQGVDSQQNIDGSFKGTTSAITFSNAEYGQNIIYPDVNRWDAGYYNNLLANSKYISSPGHSLPEIFLSGRDVDQWLEKNELVNNIEYPDGNHPLFITFRPNTNESNTEWINNGTDWTEKCYLQFSNANISSAPISTIYGIFEVREDIVTSRPLIHFVNSVSGKRFEINISSYTVSYVFDGQEIYSEDTFGQEHVVVGINIQRISNQFNSLIANFFSSYNSIEVYVGGAPDTQSQNFETFEGKIYKVAFADSNTFNQISEHFDASGIAIYSDDSLFIGHFATYCLIPVSIFNRFILDISTTSLWEEYYPLDFFSKYIKNSRGEEVYSFDYLQFNIGIPNILNSDQVKIYATFQLIEEGADEPLSSFLYTKSISENNVVDAQEENLSGDLYKAYKTIFEIKNDSIIYPPTEIAFNKVAMVLHIIINNESNISTPIKIRNLEITSRALDKIEKNPISTRFGNKIYPYRKSGIYIDHIGQNPICINKKNNPYLYLTKNSGLKVLNYSDENFEYGTIFPINYSAQENFFIGGVQIFFKQETESINTDEYVAFEMITVDTTIEFVLLKDSSGLRRILFARDKFSKNIYQNIVYYQNGIICKNPYLLDNEWNILGLLFINPIDFSNFVGSMNIFAGSTVNNLSFYLTSGLNETVSLVSRIWSEILSDGVTTFNWEYWYDQNGTSDVNSWSNIYIVPDQEERSYSLTPEDIYKRYSGTNIEVIDDNSGISLDNDSFIIFSDVTWSTTTEKPV